MIDLRMRSTVAGREAAGMWWEGARCVGRSDLFFPPAEIEPDDERLDRERAAIMLCALCPIRARCLGYALRHDIRYGIWGGRTARERAATHGSHHACDPPAAAC